MKTFLALVALFMGAAAGNAAIIQLNLAGSNGVGLLPANENPDATGTGSGGEIGAGIFFDNVSLVLTINVGWGAGQGFANLTGTATDAHIHLIPADPPGDRFLQNGSVTIGFPGNSNFTFTASGSNGSVTGSQTLTAAQVTALNEQRLYVNVHTTANGSGEIRGNIVPVPEPTALAFVALGALGAIRRRR